MDSRLTKQHYTCTHTAQYANSKRNCLFQQSSSPVELHHPAHPPHLHLTHGPSPPADPAHHTSLTGVDYGDVEVGGIGSKWVHCITSVLAAVLGMGPSQHQTVVSIDVGTVTIGLTRHLISGRGGSTGRRGYSMSAHAWTVPQSV